MIPNKVLSTAPVPGNLTLSGQHCTHMVHAQMRKVLKLKKKSKIISSGKISVNLTSSKLYKARNLSVILEKTIENITLYKSYRLTTVIRCMLKYHDKNRP